MNHDELFDLLECKYQLYNQAEFIETDPIQIPHLFTKTQDIEISGFIAATLAWGQRPTIIRNAKYLMEQMDYAPHDFVLNFEEKDLVNFKKFKHRTFNGEDCITFLQSFQNIYKRYKSLEDVFLKEEGDNYSTSRAISGFKRIFLADSLYTRTSKHIADPLKNSAAKRINMFLRWMVRQDNFGVDFGIWNKIKPSDLYCPLDVHSSNVARKLGLLSRKQNDWKAVDELTNSLRELDSDDPVKYDFALFGLGVFEGF
jgi:uncharacterized protein (TIGR02757 family)